MAQHERELISSRTKAGLAVKRKQGVQLGKPENLTYEARIKGVETIRRRAVENPNSRPATAMITSLRKAGMNYSEIAKELNRSGFKTPKGKEFQAVQVQRLYSRIPQKEELV